MGIISFFDFFTFGLNNLYAPLLTSETTTILNATKKVFSHELELIGFTKKAE
jgi:hypothetical protein